jgi:ADP-ribosylglycohydrolase
MPDPLIDRARGCILGLAVGDALGGSTEGYPPEAIRERFGGWVVDIVGPWSPDWRHARPISPYHKGDGHVTDDTLMTVALANVYQKVRDHLTPFELAEHLVPELAERVVYVPELERETVLLNRLFLAEKFLVLRLRSAGIDPREAGVGNVVNCGAAMYMAPVGIVNAGDPAGAYREAIDLAGAHQSSYGREAAGVMAAAVAAALRPGATVDDVVATCLALARDGTRAATLAVTEAARGVAGWEAAIPVLRDAVRPYDTVGEHYREPDVDARRPSRRASIEELPVALGFLVATGGSYVDAVLGGVNYGRDSDSIAQMAGAIAGALHGETAVPKRWVEAVSTASRRDFRAVADGLAQVATEVLARDRARWADRLAGFPRAAATMGG